MPFNRSASASASAIQRIVGREMLDSRGNPTVEAEVVLVSGAQGRALVPSGASTGRYEAKELRDGGDRFAGKGVQKAVGHVNDEIAKALLGSDAQDQQQIDATLIELDGTDDKRRLGANALLGVSLAVAKAAAAHQNLPLYRHIGGVGGYIMPLPYLNVLNGGAHADNNLDFQEFMLAPHGAPSFAESLRWGVEVYHTLRRLLAEKSLSTGLGDEGGFAPDLSSNKEALDLLSAAVEAAGYRLGEDISLAADIAASEFCESKDGSAIYTLRGDTAKGKPRSFTSEEFVAELAAICRDYAMVSVEDPLAEDDWNGWQQLTAEIGSETQLVGDDLFVTNMERLNMGFARNAANAILIKPNQIGTLTETVRTLQAAQSHSYGTMMSHRSGETEDNTVADLAVATNCGQIKSGAPARSDRTAKYNQLLRIEEELGEAARFWPREAEARDAAEGAASSATAS